MPGFFVSDQRATLRLNRFYEASSIPVARHLSASRFQWQLLGGLMNSTGHSVCPHATPDWISVLCWLNAKFWTPLSEKHTHPPYLSLFNIFKLWSEKKIDKRYTLWNRNDQALPSKGWAHVWHRSGLNVRAMLCCSRERWGWAKKAEWERMSGGSEKWMWCLNAKMFVRRSELLL